MTRHATRALLASLLALMTLHATTAAGLAISGLASPGPAVEAQYPDAQGVAPGTGPTRADLPPTPTLLDLDTAARAVRSPGSPGSLDEEARRDLVERSVEAVTANAGPGVRELGPVPLLLAAIAVLAAAGLIRHRRGVLEGRGGGPAFG